MFINLARKLGLKKEPNYHDQKFLFESSSEYYEKLRLIGLELFNKYIYSNDFQNEVILAWGALFHLISGQLNIGNDEREEIKRRIKERLEYLLQIPEQMKSNWRLGFAASVYFYVLKKMGLNVDELRNKIYSILNNANFYRISGSPEIPAFLGFTFAMFNETCNNDECKLYYLFYKKINNEEIDEEVKFNKSDLVESLLAYYLYKERSGLQLNQLWTQIIREVMGKDVNKYIKIYEPYESEDYNNEIFIPQEKLFLLLILMKLLNLDKVWYVVGISDEKEIQRILDQDKEIEKANRRGTIILISLLIPIIILTVWGFVIPIAYPTLFFTLLHFEREIIIVIISYVLGIISILEGILKKLFNWLRVKRRVN